jgi:hypothetical protein
MINLQTYSEVLRRVSELERMEGNCGRAFRRFLKQMFFGKTSQLLSVEYVGYSDKQLGILEYAQLCAYVESKSRHASLELLSDFSDIMVFDNLFDKTYNLVGVTLKLRESVDIDTASVPILRRLARDLRRIVFLFFENYTPEAVGEFVAGSGLDLTEEEEAALTSSVEGYAVELSPRAAYLLKYFRLEKFDAMSYLNKALLKAA